MIQELLEQEVTVTCRARDQILRQLEERVEQVSRQVLPTRLGE